VVKEHWSILASASAATLPAFRTIPALRDALRDHDDADVLDAVKDLKEGRTAAIEPLRVTEYRQLLQAALEQPGELPSTEGEYFFARRFVPAGGLPAGLSRLVLLPKLREVRAQVGFTRIEASSPDLQGEFDLRVTPAALSLQQDWLPASEIRGEGFFLQLDEHVVRSWESSPTVLARAVQLEQGYAQWAKRREGAPPFPGPRFYLLHSLAHLLINAVSLECGYPASAIRERIYCGPANGAQPMAGILLSTGTSGSEGTLGGLVEEGRRIAMHLEQALESGRLCSNDPVCASHSPGRDLGERWLEGAACHGCLFVAECSCERFNHYLDRALVVPTIGHEGLAFFGAV